MKLDSPFCRFGTSATPICFFASLILWVSSNIESFVLSHNFYFLDTNCIHSWKTTTTTTFSQFQFCYTVNYV